MNDLPQAPLVSDGETIRPIDFSLPPQEDGRKRWRPGPVATATTLLLLLASAVLWFLLGARSVAINLEPDSARLRIDGGFHVLLAGRHLLRPGEYRLFAEARGHYPLEQDLTVNEALDQSIQLRLERLPGLLSISSVPAGAAVHRDGELLGHTNGDAIELAAGPQQLQISAPRYRPEIVEIDITGMQQQQSHQLELAADWGTYSLSTEPSGAVVWRDNEQLGDTPLSLELLSGEQQLTISKDGYKAAQLNLIAVAEEVRQLEPITLQPADAMLRLRSQPAGANVTVAEVFQGQTPLDLAVDPDRAVTIRLFKVGFQAYSRELTLRSGQQRTLEARLEALTGQVTVQVMPADAEVLVNGKVIGRGTQSLSLPATAQRIQARAPGYADSDRQITPKPGFPQTVTLQLLTESEARWASIKPQIKTAAGQDMLLIRPTRFTMGASRREPGRRANETLREVQMERAYYLSTHEVTNAEFRAFRAGHSSGNVGGKSVNGNRQPVVNVGWEDAALYCNWLSERDGLNPVYTMSGESVSGFSADANGYRLPSEAEWAFAARVGQDGKVYKFPWGDTWPPGKGAGNFADQSATRIVGQTIEGYQDGEITTAPVGQFKENWRGFFDLGGNVSEWIHDFYAGGINAASKIGDPMGPDLGEFHVIRDSSFQHGSIVELRLSFRDYGKEARPDLGFRLARYAE